MKDNVYFDNAATTWPKPDAVYRFMDMFNRDIGVNAGRGSHAMAADADHLVRQTRRLLAAFVGFTGSSERVVFASNGTDALNAAIHGLVEPGSHVVTSALEHNAVARVLSHGVRDRNLDVTRVRTNDEGYIDLSALQDSLRPDTSALIITHASNVVGSVQPLADVCAVARNAGVPVILDAAQTVGVVQIDMDALGIAVVAFPGHKGLFGPMGSGALVIAEEIELRPQRFGGTGVDSASVYQPESLPWRLEPGTLNMPAIAGLHAAQLWFRALGEALQSGEDVTDWAGPSLADADSAMSQADAVSLDEHAALCRLAQAHVHRRECQHLDAIIAMLRQYPDIRLLAGARADRRVATLSFVHETMDAQQIADRLDADHGICCRAGLQCAPWAHQRFGTFDTGGSVRLSPGYFTDDEDLAQLEAGLADLFGG